MPTYEYACKDCGHHLEVVQAFTDDALTECPNCSGQLRKVFSPIGISFKGSGFYKTDSRSGSSKSTAAASDKKESASDKSSSTSESKSDAKSDSKGDSGSKGDSTSKSDSSSSSSSKSEAKSA
jgi:putative FmdB family regulatory protein